MTQYPQPPHVPPNLPPQPPLQYATPNPVAIDLRGVATKQRALMFCILGYFALIFLRFAVTPDIAIGVALVGLAVSVTAAVFVFMLAIQLYGTGPGIALGVCTLIPLVGLITLLIVNNKATNLLKQHGVKVGLLGADPKTIPG